MALRSLAVAVLSRRGKIAPSRCRRARPLPIILLHLHPQEDHRTLTMQTLRRRLARPQAFRAVTASLTIALFVYGAIAPAGASACRQRTAAMAKGCPRCCASRTAAGAAGTASAAAAVAASARVAGTAAPSSSGTRVRAKSCCKEGALTESSPAAAPKAPALERNDASVARTPAPTPVPAANTRSTAPRLLHALPPDLLPLTILRL